MDHVPEWLALNTLAPYFGEPDHWQANYLAYVEEKIGSTERLWDKLVNRIYLGSEAWCKSIRKIVESKMLSDVHPRVQRAVGRPKMASIVASVAKAFGVTRIQPGSDGRPLAKLCPTSQPCWASRLE